MAILPQLQLKANRDKSVRRRHPWIFSGAIASDLSKLPEGSLVKVADAQQEVLGVGFLNSGSIACKMLSFKNCEIDQQFWITRLAECYARRAALGLTDAPDTNAFRLVNAEGDGLPGLIVDCYGRVLVVQAQAQAMYDWRNQIASALKKVVAGISGIYLRVVNKTELDLWLFGGSDQDTILENGIKYSVDWIRGQKTGFFLDQRDNRLAIRKLAAAKSILNLFSYTGGFSLAALKGNARQVVSVDSSEPALSLLKTNLELNNLSEEHQSIRADCFDFLTSLTDTFDLIVLDPPALAKHRSAIKSGLDGYEVLNSLALARLPCGGLLATFSCSQLIGRDEFRLMLMRAALRAKKEVSIIDTFQAAPCHPVSLHHPEGEYLKGYLLLVRQ